MATSGSVFSETLQEITDTKLKELSKRRASFEEAKAAALAAVDAVGAAVGDGHGSTHNAIRRIELLCAGVKRCFSIRLDNNGAVVKGHTKHPGLETQLANLDRFLAQARNDPSVSAEMMFHSWERSLRRHLDTQSMKYQYASLYGQPVTEWLDGHRADRSEQSKPKVEAQEGDVEMGEAFEDLGNAAKRDARMEWEKTVFSPAAVDVSALERFLPALFGVDHASGKHAEDLASKKEKGFSRLLGIRRAVAAFETQLVVQGKLDPCSLRWTINGLLDSGLLSDEKREVLRDFRGNEIILGEIADVLNMRLAAVDSWSWGDEVVPEQRRKISGVYNITMNEDLLQAILLQYIGVKWSVFLKGAFEAFYGRRHDGHWQRMGAPVTREERRRLGYYLGGFSRKDSLQFKRQRFFHKGYFVSSLMTHETQLSGVQEGEEEAEYESRRSKRTSPSQNQQMAMQQQAQMMLLQQSAAPVQRQLGAARERSAHPLPDRASRDVVAECATGK